LRKTESWEEFIKRIPIYFNSEPLAVVSTIQGSDGLSLSHAVNLSLNMSAVLARERLPLSCAQLLDCCDLLPGGAKLSIGDEPTPESILNAVEAMRAHLMQSASSELRGVLRVFSVPDLYVLALASRHYCLGVTMDNKRPVCACVDRKEWAKQWIR
jgi:hypothetical protein